MKFELKPYHRNISDKQLIEDLKKVALKIGKDKVTRNEYNHLGKYSNSTLRKRFGGWTKALKLAGLLSTRNIDLPSDEDLIKDLKSVASKLNKNKVTRDEYNKHGSYKYYVYTKRFGNWLNALKESGLSATRKYNIPNEDLFQNLMRIWTKIGKQPRREDINSQISEYSSGTYENRFGGWRKALEEFVKWTNDGEIETGLPNSKSETKTNTQKPKVIKNKRRTSRTVNYRLRFLVMRRDNFKCKITGKSPATDPNVILEVDHIVPWDKGGETVMENLQTLAKEINIGKSNLDMYENTEED